MGGSGREVEGRQGIEGSKVWEEVEGGKVHGTWYAY